MIIFNKRIMMMGPTLHSRHLSHSNRTMHRTCNNTYTYESQGVLFLLSKHTVEFRGNTSVCCVRVFVCVDSFCVFRRNALHREYQVCLSNAADFFIGRILVLTTRRVLIYFLNHLKQCNWYVQNDTKLFCHIFTCR